MYMMYSMPVSGVATGWTGVDMVHPSFPRNRFSNFSKSVEKTCGGLIFIHFEHLVVQLWLLRRRMDVTLTRGNLREALNFNFKSYLFLPRK